MVSNHTSTSITTKAESSSSPSSCSCLELEPESYHNYSHHDDGSVSTTIAKSDYYPLECKGSNNHDLDVDLDYRDILEWSFSSLESSLSVAKKSVSFPQEDNDTNAKLVQSIPSLHINDYTCEERYQCWWRIEELQQSQQPPPQQLLADDDDDDEESQFSQHHATVGWNLLPNVYSHLKQTRTCAIQAVLKEQAIQRQHPNVVASCRRPEERRQEVDDDDNNHSFSLSLEEENDNHDPEEHLAQVYSEYTRDSKMAAYLLGIAQEQVARQILSTLE